MDPALASSAPRLPPAVEDDLARVETRLDAELASRESRMQAIARHLVHAGGKRIRPTVVLLVFHAAAGNRPQMRRDDAIEAAVALELIHSATLLHDDIIDGGETRRGRPSALCTFGVADTLVAGDFLFSRAFALCARFEPEVPQFSPGVLDNVLTLDGRRCAFELLPDLCGEIVENGSRYAIVNSFNGFLSDSECIHVLT